MSALKAWFAKWGMEVLSALGLAALLAYTIGKGLFTSKQKALTNAEEALNKSLEKTLDEQKTIDSAGINADMDYEDLRRRYLDSQKVSDSK